MSIQCPTCLTDNTDDAINCIACGTPLVYTSNSSASSALDLAAGTLLGQGRYQIEKVLGRGGFGITYQGIFLQNSAYIAIKELWPEGAARQKNTVLWPSSLPPIQKQQQLKKFQLEASYLHQCIHPNIVRIYEWFEENNTAYLVMELLSGRSLQDILEKEGPLPEDKVKYYLLQIAESLKVIHANRLLHRDIKPDNIIVDSQDRAVLIDFGAAREFMAGQTGDMTRILTPGYAPYEQYIQSGKRYPATDFYALCASMYELLTGQLPAEATERANTLLQGSTSTPLIPPRQLRPNLSPLIEKVILTGMQFRVEDRFQTADELIDALNGKFISPSHKRAQELVKQGKLAEAVLAYEKYLNSEPNNGEAAVELAIIQLHLDETQAEIAAKKAMQLKPNDGRSYGVLGLVNCRKSNWSEALKNLEQAANLAPQEVWIQANLAWALGKSGNWQQAENTVNKALQLDANCTFALGLQAWIAVNQEQWKSGIRTASQAIFKSKQSSYTNSQELQRWVYPYLIFALDKAVVTKQASDVERRIQEFITQVPDNSFGWGFKGWKAAVKCLWTDAISDFEQASRKSKVSSWILINQGIAQEYLHNFQAAIQAYETHTQQFSPHAFVLFRLGTLYGRLGQWEKARSYLEKAVHEKSNYAEAYHNLGWVLLNIKDQDGQVENFREILSSYRKAVELYTEQQKHPLAQGIKQVFQAVGVNNF
ncbi:serine/threonine protein kinase with TPR repeats (plasmid) [Trichormus variabilis ATCC 29413]|uniref:Serine/threonine protein kinase with TPR repeats n=2 Tax=Anabaena variabilis TaxID=264691 RepID=Q3M1P7_TRIV2|nr:MULTISPECIES: protein kinase [Nostocaceae]ABA25089.1 serine/threonine protein kinase with TPR repeats [Trichormus variabilis ATCC 29413]MBC1218119.1 protein kinase [Trichormus variabilis ARAD]MBC1259385.1 protein kinase [Trichormus variabilis V5]MBC1270900.1 protein kinase [Trichormus variabilis FSR]MBC1305813.1 protein kinase [Trichormus variabilis N2B]